MDIFSIFDVLSFTLCLLDSWDLLESLGFCKELLEEHGKSPDAVASSKYAPGTKFVPLGCTDVHCAFTLFYLFLDILYSPTYALQGSIMKYPLKCQILKWEPTKYYVEQECWLSVKVTKARC